MINYLRKILESKKKFEKALESGLVVNLQSDGFERAQKRSRYISWPRMDEIVSVDYIRREGDKFGRKLRAEGLLKEEGTCFKIFKNILTIGFFILLTMLFDYVTE